MIENIHTISVNSWTKSVEFGVGVMTSNGNVTHASLKLIIPPEFEDDLTGTGGVVKKESRCPYCGGPNH